MKNRIQIPKLKIEPNIVASFGRAQLVQFDGPIYEIRGGTDEDRTAAKEWVSLFLHEVLLWEERPLNADADVTQPPRPGQRSTAPNRGAFVRSDRILG